jgi:SP family general alpha glucoside:H+ symporter-like MFS transporter
VIQWVWPIPLFIAAYLAPESPWNAVRRGKPELAKASLVRLNGGVEAEKDAAASLAYIEHTTRLEIAETGNASFIECFKGTNWWRTEIVRLDSFHRSR